jgi:hypothetical protein
MLRTCIGAEAGTAAKDYPNFAENKVRVAAHNGNGDLPGHREQAGRGWGGEVVTTTELGEVLSELLPEDIPGLPRHRPGEFSPTR